MQQLPFSTLYITNLQRIKAFGRSDARATHVWPPFRPLHCVIILPQRQAAWEGAQPPYGPRERYASRLKTAHAVEQFPSDQGWPQNAPGFPVPGQSRLIRGFLLTGRRLPCQWRMTFTNRWLPPIHIMLQRDCPTQRASRAARVLSVAFTRLLGQQRQLVGLAVPLLRIRRRIALAGEVGPGSRKIRVDL